MSIDELISGEIVSAGVMTELAELAVIMDTAGVGSVAIIDHAGDFVGIVTDRDIVKAVAQDSQPTTPAKDLMTVSPDTVEVDTDVADAVSWLNATGYRHLPVTREGKLVGVLSIKDLLWAVSDS